MIQREAESWRDGEDRLDLRPASEQSVHMYGRTDDRIVLLAV